MKRVSDIDAFASERPMLSAQQKETRTQAKIQQQKEAGYQQLIELCHLGEYNAAQQLANRNSSWGYEIVNGEVMEKGN